MLIVLLISETLYAQTYVAQVKMSNGKWGYINIAGDMIVPAKFDKCFPFSCNLAAIYDNVTSQFYFINSKGEQIHIQGESGSTEPAIYKIKDTYLYTSLFSDYVFGDVRFSDGLIPVKNMKWGYINDSGKVSIPFLYSDVTDFNGGYATAYRKTKFVILDVHGKETPINIPELKDVSYFSEGLASFETFDAQKGYVDTKGNIVISATFKSVGNFHGGAAWAKTQDGKVGFITKSGAWLVKPVFAAAHDFDPESGLALVKFEDGKWEYIDASGKCMAVDTDFYKDFKNGLAVGERKGKFGFFNSKGEWAIKPQFDDVRHFKNGYAAAKLGSKWGIIDKKGNWIISPVFEGIKDMEVVE